MANHYFIMTDDTLEWTDCKEEKIEEKKEVSEVIIKESTTVLEDKTEIDI